MFYPNILTCLVFLLVPARTCCAIQPTDNLTDAERFELAQSSLAKLTTGTRASDRTATKPGNAFAGLMDSDSD